MRDFYVIFGVRRLCRLGFRFVCCLSSYLYFLILFCLVWFYSIFRRVEKRNKPEQQTGKHRTRVATELGVWTITTTCLGDNLSIGGAMYRADVGLAEEERIQK